VTPIAADALRGFLDARDLGSGPLEVVPVGEGHSLETYRIRRPGLDAILRKPPSVRASPTAHDVLREARVLNGLGGSCVRAPVVLAACADPAILGAPFVVTGTLPGRVIATSLPKSLDTPAQRRGISVELVDALVELHRFDWAGSSLADLSRTDNYLERQLTRFHRIWHRDGTRDVPGVEEVFTRLCETAPSDGDVTLIHGDYRLGNVLFDIEAPARLTGILDWETCTLGDPVSDVAYLLATYPDADDEHGVLLSMSSVVTREGFMTRAELAARYAAASGRSLENLDWYLAFAQWKVAIILEGSYRKHVDGLDDDPFFAELELGVPELIGRAGELVARM
jgi:aminoglycoside phosphotransferase (APT) family kinase protein